MRIRMSALALVGVVALAVTCAAQEEGKPAMDPHMQAMMASLEKYGTPGPEHQHLLKAVGTWDVQSKMWMDPAAEPLTSKGVSVQRAILGGRYIQYDFEGDMMGSPFSGYGISGYDRYNQKYLSLWLDTMGTGFYLTEGTCDERGQVCTETGVWDDITTGQKANVKNVFRHLSDDRFTMEMYMVSSEGQETKTMELTYTRRK